MLTCWRIPLFFFFLRGGATGIWTSSGFALVLAITSGSWRGLSEVRVLLLGNWEMFLELGVEPESMELDDKAETEAAFLWLSPSANILATRPRDVRLCKLMASCSIILKGCDLLAAKTPSTDDVWLFGGVTPPPGWQSSSSFNFCLSSSNLRRPPCGGVRLASGSRKTTSAVPSLGNLKTFGSELALWVKLSLEAFLDFLKVVSKQLSNHLSPHSSVFYYK